MNIESILSNRFVRLARNTCLLGEPDIISIRQTKHSTNFFHKEKKVEDLQQNFINGLIFPTTAHFSSFISTRYKARDPAKLTIKAKLLMFDAYGEKDIHIQINIPGSLQIKAYNIKGIEVAFKKQDYEKAYFSSFLRSLYPMNYPNIILYPLLNRLQLLKVIIKTFIAFSYKNELRQLNYQFEIYRSQTPKQQSQTKHNLSIEIVINYCIQNHYTNLLKIVLQELKKINPSKYHETELRCKLMQKKYGQIISKTAQKLLLHGHANRLKQHQIQALFPLKKYAEIAYIGKPVVEDGGSEQITKCILISLIQTGQDIRFLKSLNLINNLYNFNQKKVRQASYLNNNNGLLNIQTYLIDKNKSLSEYPQFCFPFDNNFYNRLSQYKNILSILLKNSKEGSTIALLDSIQASLNNNPLFYDILVRYQKSRGWGNLMKFRTDSFWLQADFYKCQEVFKTSNSKEFNDNYSFFDQKFQETEQNLELQQQQFKLEEQKSNQKDVNQPKVQKYEMTQEINQKNEQSFDGNLSEHQQQKQQFYLPKCSSRVNTTRKPKTQKRKQSKILCGVPLQKLFILLYNDIKIQNSLQAWELKLKQAESNEFSQQKKEVTAVIYLKKGFLHRKLQRNKKCEESFKMARKFSNSYSINLVAIYQLLLLYIDNKNTKGVEFYLIELMKMFKALGLQTFDIVPEWARPVIQYVLSSEGLSIIKNIHPIFKAVFAIFLRANYSEEEVQNYTQLKK